MTNSSIPDFLKSHNQETEKKQIENPPEQSAPQTDFIPKFEKHETVESFRAPQQISDETPKTENENAENTDNDSAETNNKTETSKDEVKQQRVSRGSKPLLLNLEESVKIVQEIYEKAGGGVTLDGFSQIAGNSIASSSFSRKITALRAFNLIDTENKNVTLTKIADRIVAPRTVQERMQGLKQAFCSVPIFEQVYSRWRGRILPQDEFLVNSFKDLVPRDLTAIWMKKFKESATYANLLLDRGDGKFQVIDEPISSEPNPDAGSVDEGVEKKDSIETQDEVKPPDNPANNSQNHAPAPQQDQIKTISLRHSKKSIWLGSDANILQIKFGEDMDFVLALIKLFDLYENSKRFEIKEIAE